MSGLSRNTNSNGCKDGDGDLEDEDDVLPEDVVVLLGVGGGLRFGLFFFARAVWLSAFLSGFSGSPNGSIDVANGELNTDEDEDASPGVVLVFFGVGRVFCSGPVTPSLASSGRNYCFPSFGAKCVPSPSEWAFWLNTHFGYLFPVGFVVAPIFIPLSMLVVSFCAFPCNGLHETIVVVARAWRNHFEHGCGARLFDQSYASVLVVFSSVAMAFLSRGRLTLSWLGD